METVHIILVMNQMFVSLSNLFVEVLSPSVMVKMGPLGEVIRIRLGHEGGVLMMG